MNHKITVSWLKLNPSTHPLRVIHRSRSPGFPFNCEFCMKDLSGPQLSLGREDLGRVEAYISLFVLQYTRLFSHPLWVGSFLLPHVRATSRFANRKQIAASLRIPLGKLTVFPNSAISGRISNGMHSMEPIDSCTCTQY